jgi:hypothetical protein
VSTKHEEPLSGSPGDIRTKAAELASGHDLHEYLAGMWLRELAVKLETFGDLAVSVRSYDHPSRGQELDVTLISAPDCGSITISNSPSGNDCLITFDRWLSISDQPAVENVVNVIRSVLSANACPRSGRKRLRPLRWVRAGMDP